MVFAARQPCSCSRPEHRPIAARHVSIIILAIDIRTVPYGSLEHEQAILLRRRVLRWPLDRDFTDEELAAETDQFHLVGIEDGEVVACALLQRVGDSAKMRQVAVSPELQGQGVGRKLVAAFEELTRERGLAEVILNARQTAVPFYERLGYAVVEEPFDEVGIPHRKMRKRV